MSSFEAMGTLAVAQSIYEPTTKFRDEYDLVISSLSWENRLLTSMAILAEQSRDLYVLKFESRSEAVESKKLEILSSIERMFDKIHSVDLSSAIENSSNFSKIEEFLKNKYHECGKPLKILLDMTCVPKCYLIFLLGLGYSRDYVSAFDFLYASGNYEKLVNNADDDSILSISPRSLLSEGDWQSVQIPYMTGNEYIPESRDIVVALGKELGQSLPFIERLEPKQLELLFISDAVPIPADGLMNREKIAFDEIMNEPNVSRRDMLLFDVKGVARTAIDFARSSTQGGVSAMAIGCKTHALGLGLAALSEPNIEIICRRPSSYRPVQVESSGDIYFFQTEDRFEPSIYL